MKKYCLNCSHRLKEDTLCPSCHCDNNLLFLESETQERKRECNKQLRKLSEKKNGSLSILIISCILIILSAVLFILSYRYTPLREKIFSPTSVEFITCVIFLILAVSGFIYSIISIILIYNKKKYFKSILKEARQNKDIDENEHLSKRSDS